MSDHLTWKDEVRQLREAVGLLTTLHPTLVMNADDPLGMAQAIVAHVEAGRDELERERMRLAACGVVAMANTPDSAASARVMHPDYRSASLDDIERAVDEQMKLRADLATAANVTAALTMERDAALAERDQLRKTLEEDQRIAKEEISKRDAWNIELLRIIRLALETAEHAQQNNRALTGGDERRLASLITVCRTELMENEGREDAPVMVVLKADYERLVASLPTIRSVK